MLSLWFPRQNPPVKWSSIRSCPGELCPKRLSWDQKSTNCECPWTVFWALTCLETKRLGPLALGNHICFSNSGEEQVVKKKWWKEHPPLLPGVPWVSWLCSSLKLFGPPSSRASKVLRHPGKGVVYGSAPARRLLGHVPLGEASQSFY